MKTGRFEIDVFKIKNRQGYAAVCNKHLTEGATRKEALERMEKALSRTMRLGAKKK